MKDLSNKTVLITGGASGIGKIMVRLMLERNAKVIIWDINQSNIDQTILEFSNLGTVLGYNIDVSDGEQINKMAQKTKQEVGSIDVLINNAGIITGKYFHEHTQSEITATMAINATAPMLIAQAFLSDMVAQNSGHICTIASSGGLLSNPKMSVYVASKWAAIGWSDSLRIEMKQLKKNINITTIMPYYISTGMFAGVKSLLPILKPETVALTIIKAIENNKTMVSIPGYIYRLTRLSQALLPINIFDWLVGGILGIYKTMEDFTGRKN